MALFFFSAVPITPEKRHDNMRGLCGSNKHEPLSASRNAGKQAAAAKEAGVHPGWVGKTGQSVMKVL